MKSGEHLLWKSLSHPDSLGNSVIEGSSELHTVCIHLKPLAGLFFSFPSSISVSSAGMSYHFSCLFNICFLLCPVLIFYESWSFSHIQDSVDNPKDNSICLILEWAFRTPDPSLHWKNKQTKPKTHLTGFSRALLFKEIGWISPFRRNEKK